MGLFSRKDWNVIVIIYERKDCYRVNGNRGRGGEAVKIRDGAKKHSRTLYWAVFDQKRAFLEGGPGPGKENIPADILQRLQRELPTNGTIQQILALLEGGKNDKAAKPLVWGGYPKEEAPAM